jgi:glycosyltransferase involved in cell wall biosynthesis
VAIFFRYGAEEHLTFLPPLPELARRLGERFEVHHFGMRSPLPRPAALPESLIIHHLPLFTVRRQSTFDKFLKAAVWLLALPGLGLYCRCRGFRAVFVDETVPLTALLLRLCFGPRVAFTVHDFFTEIYFDPRPALRPLGRLLRTVDLFAWRRLRLLITRVQKTRDYLVERGVRPERIVTVGDGGDLDLFRPGDRAAARARWGLAPEEIVLIHHGVLHPNKGNDRVLRALARLRDFPAPLRFLCLGDGPALPALRALARELGVEDRVTFTGWVDRLEDVALALQAADIGLAMRIGHPSDHFHLTSTLVHNMASGLPVLAARLAGFRDVLREEENALLFDPDRPEDLAAQWRRLAEDPVLRTRLAAAALATARERFDPRDVAGRLAEHLSRLADAPVR